MSTRDNYTAALYQQSLKPQTIAASALNSGNVDTQGYESLSVAILVGDISETLGSGSPVAQIDLKIEHAADDGTGAPGTYAACVDADVLGFTGLTAGLFKTIDTAGEENRRYVIGYRGVNRFVRVTATPQGLSTGGAIAMMAIKGHPHEAPADNS